MEARVARRIEVRMFLVVLGVWGSGWVASDLGLE